MKAETIKKLAYELEEVASDLPSLDGELEQLLSLRQQDPNRSLHADVRLGGKGGPTMDFQIRIDTLIAAKKQEIEQRLATVQKVAEHLKEACQRREPTPVAEAPSDGFRMVGPSRNGIS